MARFGQPIVAVHRPFSPATPGWPGLFDEPGQIRASVQLAEAVGAEVVIHPLKGYVKYVHLSNYDGREHRRPGMGRLYLDRLIEQIARDEYDGAITLELHPYALDAGKEDERIVELLGE